MQLSVEQKSDVRIVHVKETRLTYPVLSSFFGEMRRLVEGGARKVVIDLGAVAFIDSASIGCLIGIHQLLQDCDGTVKLSGAQRRVHTMLSMAGIHRMLEIHTKAAEALAGFDLPSCHQA